jgi:hypothetical protein
MALDYSSNEVTNRHLYPPKAPHSAGEVMVTKFKVDLDASLAINDLVGLVPLPANCIPVNYKAWMDDLDGASALVHDVGILNSDKDDLVASSLLVDGSTVGQSAGLVEMNDYECAMAPETWLAETDCPEAYEEKIVAMKIMTAAGTPASGSVRGLLWYRAMENGA